MNPLLSFILVLFCIILFLRALYWLQQKAFHQKLPFFKQLNLKNTYDVQCLSTVQIDDKYKVTIIRVNGMQKVILLGPTQAMLLDDQPLLKKTDVLEGQMT